MSFDEYMSIAIVGTSVGFLTITLFAFVSLFISIIIGIFRRL